LLDHVNASGFGALLYPTVNREGRETAVAIVRATFELSATGRLQPVDEQTAVRMEDVFCGDPGVSTAVEESDLAVYKPGTDVVVVGSAHARNGRPTTSVQVGVRVGDLQKTALVTGDRVYERAFGVGPVVASAPIPFTTIPLIWERSFGGVDPRTVDSKRPQFEARNPIGCGYVSGKILRSPVPGRKLPNISPLRSANVDSEEPWGFSPVGRAWQPRYPLAGTYDDRWQKERAPFLPLDFDYAFFQCAPRGLMSPRHLRGDEPVTVVNMCPDGDLAFNLPGLVMGLTVRVDGKPAQRCLAALDTVVLEPARRRVALVWRRAIVCRRSANEVLRVMSFALSRQGAAAVIGTEVNASVGEPKWKS
jgi:hypothetical protein